ncbi:MAG: Pseudopilin domain-containing protein [uncultured Campylobacterales bacterium]|uniref:Pseudopilin domain-containing protein n=1 Tax=uncultured Campylobacterales bacterium TaxID=352960 RepID=A0A6S6T3N2_9BACT|nr:MAG: Pseudopilin domain-containing protein [uncultured Campylobacterales bacterium]
MTKTAFTMIELVFVIVVLGILATVAVPRLLVTRDDAIYSKARAEISAIQSGIETQKSKNILSGVRGYPSNLDDVNSTSTPSYNANDQLLFYKDDSSNSVLQTPVFSKIGFAGHWVKTADNIYTLYIENTKPVVFTYNNSTGRFVCDYDEDDCKEILR